MAVRVHGQGDLRVAKDLHDHPGVQPLSEEQARGRVSQVVKADATNSSSCEQGTIVGSGCSCRSGGVG